MKKIAIIASLFCLAVLSSCELKDELTGTKGEQLEMGALELSVSVPQETTESRANTEAPGNYPVVVMNKETEEEAYNGTYEAMEKPLRLPVGTYIVSSHTPGDIETTMLSPYYGGEKEMTISKEITSVLDVVCKMLNTKITLNLGDDFKSAFTEWTITLNDGNSHVLTFTQANENSTIYWYLGANSQVATLTMDITATTTDGVKVRDQKQFTKADASENYENDNPNFTGGDALNINIGAIEEPDPEPGQQPQIGFDISVDITFDGRDETVEIPVEDVPTTDPEPGEPEEPGDDEVITISDGGTGYLTDGVIVTGGEFPTDVNVIMGVEKGIQNVFVKVTTTDPEFEGMVTDFGLVAGDGMDLASDGANGLAELFPLPEAGTTEYTFSMSEMLFTMLNNFKGTHDFTLKVVDKEGNEKSAVLTITVNK